MEIPKTQIYPVPDKVPIELNPLMAAYMSYFSIQVDNKARNRSKYVRRAGPMLWKLLCFIEPKYKSDKTFKIGTSSSARKTILMSKIIKSDGTYMTPMEQLELFVEAAPKNGQELQCFLFGNNPKEPIGKTSRREWDSWSVPVIQLDDGKFAGTSLRATFKCKKQDE